MKIVLALVAASAFALDGHWHLAKKIDPMTDKVSAWAGIAGAGGGIAVKCDEAGPSSVYIRVLTTTYLGEGTRELQYRIDEEPPVRLLGERYDEHGALVMNTKLVSRIVSGLRHAKRVRIRVFTYKDEEVDLDLAPDDGNDAIDTLIATCGDTHFAGKTG